MPESFDVSAGFWWRFDRYEIRDGYVRPTLGAALERFDPWIEYREARAGHGAQRRPFTDLLELVRDLVIGSAPDGDQILPLDPQGEERLSRWCGRYGLLGILPHRAHMVTLAPRWEPLEGRQDDLAQTQRQFLRTSEGWVTAGRSRYLPRAGSGGDEQRVLGAVIPMSKVPRSWPRPGVAIQGLLMPAWDHEPLSKTWASFFPDVPHKERETYPYPAPLSEAFWRSYAEPVSDFFEAATLLLGVVQGLKPIGPLSTASEGALAGVRARMDTLHKLAETVSPALEPTEDGGFHQRWLASTLLGAFAMMVLLDLTEQNRLLECEACGRLFVTTSYQARYCSDTCRYRVQKQRHRARKQALLTQGAPGDR